MAVEFPKCPAAIGSNGRAGCGAALGWARLGSNQGPTGYEPAALPLSYGPQGNAPARLANEIGAGDEIRTRDIHLGRVALYQLSYSRGTLHIVPTQPEPAKRSRPQGRHAPLAERLEHGMEARFGGPKRSFKVYCV